MANARQPLALTLPLKSLGVRHFPLAARVLAYIRSLTRKMVNVAFWPDSEKLAVSRRSPESAR